MARDGRFVVWVLLGEEHQGDWDERVWMDEVYMCGDLE